MKKWNHRVIESQQDGQTVLAIHEVHYDPDGRPMECTAPTIVDGTSQQELREMLASMSEALNLPVLSAAIFDHPAVQLPMMLALSVMDVMGG